MNKLNLYKLTINQFVCRISLDALTINILGLDTLWYMPTFFAAVPPFCKSNP